MPRAQLSNFCLLDEFMASGSYNLDMKTFLLRLTSLLLIAVNAAPQLWATCGGGGGGGMGGMSSMGGGMGMSAPQVYSVPWRVRMPDLPPVTAGLVLYWFPSSAQEVQKSSMRTSRI